MIFEDRSGNRWKITLAVFAGIIIFCTALIVVFASSIYFPPLLPSIQKQTGLPTAIKNKNSLLDRFLSDGLLLDQTNGKSRLPITTAAISQPNLDFKNVAVGRTYTIAAFINQDDPESLTAFKNEMPQIGIAIPNWYAVKEANCAINEHFIPATKDALTQSGVRLIPQVANYDAGAVYGSNFSKILAQKSIRECLADSLADRAEMYGAAGLFLDFQGIKNEDARNFLLLIDRLQTSLHNKDRMLAVSPPLDDQNFLKELGRKVDLLIIRPRSDSISAFGINLKDLIKQLPAEKTIVTLGTGAIDQKIQGPTKRIEKFSDLMALSQKVSALPELNYKTGLMNFAYLDEKGVEHDVSFHNGVTAWNEWWLSRQFPVLGFAINPLGSEDPSLWSFIDDSDSNVISTMSVPALSEIAYQEGGEIFRMSALPTDGKLDVRTDDRGFIANATYKNLPLGYVLERIGRPIPNKNIVLTFDAGPDPGSTTRILDTLQKLNVPAVFFVVGKFGQQHPEILKEIGARGHLIGNHTYSYLPIQDMSEARLRVELNTTQRIIEAQTLMRTALFRPPFDPDRTLWNQSLAEAVSAASKIGYIVVDTSIDTKDWQNPGVEKIVSTIETEVAKPNNHVILMHDRSQNVDQTIAALEEVVPKLRNQGFQFVSLDQAIAIPVASLNSPLAAPQTIAGLVPTIVENIKSHIWTIIAWMFIVTLGISILRILVLSFFVIRSARRPHKRFQRLPSRVFASVLIPAYNEENTILKTINSIQRSVHKNIEVLVINDGSTDATAEVVRAIEKTDKRFRLINKPNGGKSSALNLGLKEAKSDIVITIDADTLLFPETISELLKSFADPTVDAVCGNVEVGNRRNLLTGFQSLEYITSQNFDRRAFDELNCISVVPGATGAWRKQKMIALGGYANDTLTEDADITLRLLRVGGKIVYCASARSQTEAPENIRALAKQRFRWSYGTFQCMRKHSDAFFHGPLGWIALPNMFIFQILFPLLSPIGDVVFIIMLIRGDIKPILLGYILFTIMDACGSFLAFTLEKRSKQQMWLVLIQRFFYRQFMYVTTFRSIFAILRGEKHGWNKLQRMGTVPEKLIAFEPTTKSEPLKIKTLKNHE